MANELHVCLAGTHLPGPLPSMRDGCDGKVGGREKRLQLIWWPLDAPRPRAEAKMAAPCQHEAWGCSGLDC